MCNAYFACMGSANETFEINARTTREQISNWYKLNEKLDVSIILYALTALNHVNVNSILDSMSAYSDGRNAGLLRLNTINSATIKQR